MKDSVIVTQCYANAREQISLLMQFIVRSIEHVLTTPFYSYCVVQKWIVFVLLASIISLLVMTLIVFIKSKKANNEKLQKKLNILSISTKVFIISFTFFLILMLISPFAVQNKVDAFLSNRDFELPTAIIDDESKDIAYMKYHYSLDGGSYEYIWDFNKGLCYYTKENETAWFNDVITDGITFNENVAQEFIDALNNEHLFEEQDYNANSNSLIIDGPAGWLVVLTFNDGTEKIYQNSNDWAGYHKWENVIKEYFEHI